MHYAYYETYIDIFPVFAYSLNIHSFGYNHCISLLFNGQVKPKALFGDKLCGLRLRGSFMCEELCLPVCRVLFGYKLHISDTSVWKPFVNLFLQRVVVCLKAELAVCICFVDLCAPLGLCVCAGRCVVPNC